MPPTRPTTHPVAQLAHRLGPHGLVVALAGLVLLGILVAAATDLRRIAAEPQPSSGGETGLAASRADQTDRQYNVRVTVSADGPFTVGLQWLDGKKVSRRSTGEDVVLSRVFEGAGPYVSVGGQLAGDGTIECRVEVDGEEADGREAEGTFAQAICAG